MEMEDIHKYVLPHVLEDRKSPYFDKSPTPWEFFELVELVCELTVDEIQDYTKRISQLESRHKKRKLLGDNHHCN